MSGTTTTITLNGQQQHALDLIHGWYAMEHLGGHSATAVRTKPWYALGGYAGSGKTTLLPIILRTLNIDPERCLIGTPTAAAARRGPEKLLAAGMGMCFCSTLHSVFMTPFPPDPEAELAELREAEAALSEEPKDIALQAAVKRAEAAYRHELEVEVHFGPNGTDMSDTHDLFVIDEFSMLNKNDLNIILSHNVPVLLFGDPAQLQVVEGEPAITSPDYTLTQVMRQANGSAILPVAAQFRAGKMPYRTPHVYGPGASVHTLRSFRKTYGCEPREFIDDEVVHLFVMNNDRRAFNVAARQALGYGTPYPVIGDRMVCKLNSVDKDLKGALPNSDLVRAASDLDMTRLHGHENARKAPMSIVHDSGFGARTMVISNVWVNAFSEFYDPADPKFTAPEKGGKSKRPSHGSVEIFDYAYGLTVHAAQGSEWPVAVVHMCGGWLPKSFLYTAATRAQEELIILWH